jgi:hypothetical protein
MRPERSREQSDSCEGDENGTGAHPTLRPRFREDSMTRWHGAALADYEPMGGGESWTKETVSGNYAPIPSPPSQDAMPRRGESQYAMRTSEARGPWISSPQGPVLRKNSIDDLESLSWMFYLCSLHPGVPLVSTPA